MLPHTFDEYAGLYGVRSKSGTHRVAVVGGVAREKIREAPVEGDARRAGDSAERHPRYEVQRIAGGIRLPRRVVVRGGLDSLQNVPVEACSCRPDQLSIAQHCFIPE